MFLYARYLPARLELENGQRKTEPQRIALVELGQLVREAQQKLNPSQEAEIKKLHDQIDVAQIERGRASRAVMDKLQPRRAAVRL